MQEKVLTNKEENQNQIETFQLHSNYDHLFQKHSSRGHEETDAIRAGANFQFHYYDIFFTATAIVSRLLALYLNIKLAIDFQRKGELHYFWWTIICICCPLGVTSIIHCFMCYEDGKFKSFPKTIQTCCFIFLSSVCLRYWKPLVYAVRCKRAENNGDKENQMRYYKKTIREESDVAFIRLFECFLESAPQKILQISIVLRQKSEMTFLQAIVICTYFGSMAWCLTVYHRYVRYSQEDKLNITLRGHICQLCWHFCTSVSRTLCISFLASVFPLWTLIGCIFKSFITGIVIFVAARPYCPKATFPKFLFCLVFGFIYLFTYISTRDESTRYKYVIYYVTCLLENIGCIILFTIFSSHHQSSPYAFYSLCSGAILFYCLGIFVMIVYYVYFHPQITARKSKRCIINNN